MPEFTSSFFEKMFYLEEGINIMVGTIDVPLIYQIKVSRTTVPLSTGNSG
jgi:hypothetical protein